MKIAMDKLSVIFARALDIIEMEQLGASEHHSARVAVLCAAMARQLGHDDDAVSALTTCALFHDNALTEYNLTEAELSANSENTKRHCATGQRNVAWLPFKQSAEGFIIYHHERENGDGPFGKKEGEYPFEAALLAAADSIDVAYRLGRKPARDLSAMRDKISANAVRYSTRKAVSALLDILNAEMLESLHDENIALTLSNTLPKWELDIDQSSVTSIAKFFAHVIDYKSVFTRKHTSQIANRAWLMAEHYGYDHQTKAALFLAASLHDIGKIATPTEVLEKPGKLDPDEFQIIKEHVLHTHNWLSEMPDFELIRNWAADHHEKLDGTGYSYQKTADELDFNARLMACIDIYQAVCEPRPYHDARTHEDTVKIMYGMADKGFIDLQIVKDMDAVMAPHSLRDIPAPV